MLENKSILKLNISNKKMRFPNNFLFRQQKPSLAELESCKKEILDIVDVNMDGKVSREELSVLLSSN